MSTYKELLSKREELEKQIKMARQQELADAVAKVKALVDEFELTVEDVFSGGRSSRKASTAVKVPPKYKNPVTGETWTGRGKAPKWIQDQDRSKFEI